MRIIKQGKKPEEQLVTGTCYNCKTEVEFAKGEAVRSYSDQRDGQGWAVKCPTCGCEIWGYE